MRDTNDPRQLRMERLETRTLLAAGIFGFSEVADFVGNDASQTPTPQGSRSVGAEESSTPGNRGRFERGADVGRRSASADRQRDFSQRQRLQQQEIAAPVNSQQSVSNQQSAITQKPVAASISVSEPVGEPIAESPRNVNSAPVTSRVVIAQTVVPVPNGIVDAAIASLTSVDSSQANEVESEVLEAVSTIEPESDTRVVENETAETTEAVQLIVSADSIPDAADDGLLHWFPLWGLNLAKPSDSKVETPWQLSQDTIPLLQRVIEASPEERGEIVDSLMADWFSGPAGLISLDRVVLPTQYLSIDDFAIDVQLESAIMLHRSLGMVATGVVPPLSGPVLDAIMASLEEAAMSQNQPIADTTILQLPSAVYPAIIAVATGIAIAARRQFKHPASEPDFESNNHV
ncbi:hypothetical protein [Aporhodopirellula aestuarii]|uniref:Uncharacterized protein n=1 Tax=Aporhodopirellula aestuarii TaxID=2950107 RepID=A0ABT0TZ35_9BACT|nr:hypothetical protein [Aporhodopirellula aestuarii]MCM2369862.1 hypothetical protein [Aporhodopirellula aestuarii]